MRQFEEVFARLSHLGFSSVLDGPVRSLSLSGLSDAGDLYFYAIPDIHGTLVKWSHSEIQIPSLSRKCYVLALLRNL